MMTSAIRRRMWIGLLGAATSVGIALAQPPTPPELFFEPLPNHFLRITWTNTASSFVLEQSNALDSSPFWQAVLQPVLAQTDPASATVSTFVGNQYFRLHVPLVGARSTSPINGTTDVPGP